MSDEPVINQDADRVMVSDENIITISRYAKLDGWQEPVNNGYQDRKAGLWKRLEAFKINVGERIWRSRSKISGMYTG